MLTIERIRKFVISVQLIIYAKQNGVKYTTISASATMAQIGWRRLLLGHGDEVGMFYDRALNHTINRIHERALRIANKNYENDFAFLLEQSKSVPIHVRNLQLLMTEIYKTKCGLNPSFMKDIFMQRNISDSRKHGDDAQLPKVRTTSFGVESIAYLGNTLWQKLPQEIQTSSLPVFKKQIRCWNSGKCNCRLCKVYISEVGFLTG